ncbi:MAG: class I SAM-dependent methyltransferase [Treponema sp.]|nr:class I SAM-dependent methyltransferase [Treponema sp.]
MKKTVWDLFAPFYELAMKSQKNQYDYLYEHILPLVKDKKVLELATGPGMIAKHLAQNTSSMIATDFSPDMIKTAKKGKYPGNLTFEVADAAKLHYEDNSFDVVIMANALHIMPFPEKALSESRRVLKNGGLFIAPNFIGHSANDKKNIWTKFLETLGVKFQKNWNEEEYKAFLSENGWTVKESALLKGRIDVLYTVCLIDS